jgi:hypothetical protein
MHRVVRHRDGARMDRDEADEIDRQLEGVPGLARTRQLASYGRIAACQLFIE